MTDTGDVCTDEFESQDYTGVRISIVNPLLALSAFVHKIPENCSVPRITLT